MYECLIHEEEKGTEAIVSLSFDLLPLIRGRINYESDKRKFLY